MMTLSVYHSLLIFDTDINLSIYGSVNACINQSNVKSLRLSHPSWSIHPNRWPSHDRGPMKLVALGCITLLGRHVWQNHLLSQFSIISGRPSPPSPLLIWTNSYDQTPTRQPKPPRSGTLASSEINASKTSFWTKSCPMAILNNQWVYEILTHRHWV